MQIRWLTRCNVFTVENLAVIFFQRKYCDINNLRIEQLKKQQLEWIKLYGSIKCHSSANLR